MSIWSGHSVGELRPSPGPGPDLSHPHLYTGNCEFLSLPASEVLQGLMTYSTTCTPGCERSHCRGNDCHNSLRVTLFTQRGDAKDSPESRPDGLQTAGSSLPSWIAVSVFIQTPCHRILPQLSLVIFMIMMKSIFFIFLIFFSFFSKRKGQMLGWGEYFMHCSSNWSTVSNL